MDKHSKSSSSSRNSSNSHSSMSHSSNSHSSMSHSSSHNSSRSRHSSSPDSRTTDFVMDANSDLDLEGSHYGSESDSDIRSKETSDVKKRSIEVYDELTKSVSVIPRNNSHTRKLGVELPHRIPRRSFRRKQLGIKPRLRNGLREYFTDIMKNQEVTDNNHIIILGIFGHGGRVKVKTPEGDIKIPHPVPIKPVLRGNHPPTRTSTYTNLIKISLVKRGEKCYTLSSNVTDVELYLRIMLLDSINLDEIRRIPENEVKNYFNSILTMDIRKEILHKYLKLAIEYRDYTNSINRGLTKKDMKNKLEHSPFLQGVLDVFEKIEDENPIGNFEINSMNELNNKLYTFKGNIPLKILYNSHNLTKVGKYFPKNPNITLQQLYQIFAQLGFKHVVIFDFSCDTHTVPGSERRGGYEKNTKKKRSKRTKCNYKKYSGSSYTKKYKGKK